MYEYQARVVRVIDGDSLVAEAVIYPWPRQAIDLEVRLFGINARESKDPGGPEAAAHLASLVQPDSVVSVQLVKPDKYHGRVVGKVRTLLGTDLSERMVADGYAAPWDGRGPKPVPPWPVPAATMTGR